MYSYIRGDILHIDGITLSVLAEGTGLGFDILISPTVLSGIFGKDKIDLWIHHHITEAGQVLFGFDSVNERGLFRQLLKVNGIGGKTALSLLGLGHDELLRAIQLEDDVLLSSVPGIGKKTAQKIIVDLKGSIDFTRQDAGKGKTPKNTTDTTLITSLIAMGYDRTRVEEVVSDMDNTLSIETRTVTAIKELSK